MGDDDQRVDGERQRRLERMRQLLTPISTERARELLKERTQQTGQEAEQRKTDDD